MYEITKKEYLSKTSVLMNVKAPLVAAKAEAGQFIILRSDKDGERLPFTIADSDRKTGEISIVFQAEGSSTKKLALYEKGDFLEDFVGPLGKPAQLEGLEKALIVLMTDDEVNDILRAVMKNVEIKTTEKKNMPRLPQRLIR